MLMNATLLATQDQQDPTCLSLQPYIILLLFSLIMFQPHQTFGCSSYTPSSYLYQGFCSFSFSLQCFSIIPSPADFFWSLSFQLNVTNPAKTPTSPHHHHLASCPLALSSEPYVLFPHLLGFRLRALQNFAVCSILLFCSFLIFFPKVILCIYFLSCWNSVSSMYISQQKPFVSLDKSNSSLVNP